MNPLIFPLAALAADLAEAAALAVFLAGVALLAKACGA